MATTYSPTFTRATAGRSVRFKGGTGDGGIVYLPPELTLNDWNEGTVGFSPPGVSISQTYAGIACRTWWGAGIADPRGGTVRTGWSWGEGNASLALANTSGWLLFRRHDNTESATISITTHFALDTNGRPRFVNTTETNWAIFDQATFTADRTFIFPDASGIIVLTSDLASYVPISQNINTTSPLTGGGELSGDLTLSINGISTIAQGDLLYGSAADTVARLAKDATATRYLSNTGGTNNPAWAQVNAANGITGVLPIANGGTNASTALNNGRIMVSSGGGIVEAGAMTNGQLLIGSTGAAPVVAALTAGANITINNSAGGIEIVAASGGTNPVLAVDDGNTIGNTAVETSIFSYSVAGGTMSADDQILQLEGLVNLRSTSDALTIRVKGAGVTLHTIVLSASSQGFFWLEVRIVRTGATTGRSSCRVLGNTSAGYTWEDYTDELFVFSAGESQAYFASSFAVTWANANVVEITGDWNVAPGVDPSVNFHQICLEQKAA